MKPSLKVSGGNLVPARGEGNARTQAVVLPWFPHLTIPNSLTSYFGGLAGFTVAKYTPVIKLSSKGYYNGNN